MLELNQINWKIITYWFIWCKKIT